MKEKGYILSNSSVNRNINADYIVRPMNMMLVV